MLGSFLLLLRPPRLPFCRVRAEILPTDGFQRVSGDGLRQAGETIEGGEQGWDGARVFQPAEGAGSGGAADDIAAVEHGDEWGDGTAIAICPSAMAAVTRGTP